MVQFKSYLKNKTPNKKNIANGDSVYNHQSIGKLDDL